MATEGLKMEALKAGLNLEAVFRAPVRQLYGCSYFGPEVAQVLSAWAGGR